MPISKRIFWAFLCFFPAFTNAQVADTFPASPNEFITSLRTFLSTTKQEDLEKNIQSLELLVQSAKYTPGEVLQIRGAAQILRQRKLTPHPFFTKYLDVLVKLRSSAIPTTTFAQWQEVFDRMLLPEQKRSSTDLLAFLNFSSNFLTSNHLRLPVGNAVGWQIQGGTWSFSLQDNDPIIRINQAKLIAYIPQDSLQILDASGIYFPLQEQWKGTSGRTTWERAGLAPDVQTTFTDYTIDVRKGLYSVEQAKLIYPKLFGAKLITGVFTDKLSAETKPVSLNYPKFEALLEQVEIKNLGEGIRYFGGFRLEGKTVFGIGDERTRSILQLYNQRGALVFKGVATQFTVREGAQVTAERVSATIYLQGDSIYHPAVNMRFLIPSKELRLYRGNTGNERNPFFSSANQVRIDAEEMIANLEGDTVIIGKPTIAIANKAPVTFESVDFFSKQEYQQLQGLASMNPVALLKTAADKTGTRTMSTDVLAKAMNPSFTHNTIERLLFDLSASGFVEYNIALRQVEIKDKVFHYINSNTDRSDFDGIRLISKTDNTNALLNLKSKVITIQGIQWVPFSTTQRVVLVPDSNQVLLGKDRNMAFGGILQAGFSELKSSNFKFDYQKFQIHADSILYFRLFAPEKRPSENPDQEPYALTSDIEQFGGTLIIDAERNKSGKSNIPIFPSLNSTSNSYVFYDGPFAKDTAYARDSFYFELEPFNLHQLDNYTKDELKFKGWLVSAQIFPSIRETLRVQPDFSLGFNHQTPDAGYPIYGKRGQFAGALSLSNQGFSGKGTLSYLGARIKAEDYIFKPQQLEGSARDFDVPEVRGTHETPQVHGSDVKINWSPYSDSMYVTSASQAFYLFKDSTHTLTGTLIMTPNGLAGSGTLDWSRAQMESKLLKFGANIVNSDTTRVGIKTPLGDQYALQTADVQGRLDFDAKKGVFKANQGQLKTGLPFNQYETSMNEFDWDMVNEVINFKSDTAQLGTFTSMHPDQDSLTFQGRTAFYNLNSNLLNIGGVPFIKSADAFIYPDSGAIEIQPGGLITKLEDAVIVCDTITKNHTIRRASIEILGRKEYRASGFYEYPVDDKQQEIAFTDIKGTRVGKGLRSEKASATLAQGEIVEADSFLIDSKTSFYGQISLGSESVNLKFDGFAKLNSPKIPERNWFSVSMEADKKNLAIPFKSPKSEEGYPLENGLFLSKEMAFLYPRVMMPLYFRKDRAIFPARGVLRYDKLKDHFIIGDSSKVLRDDLTGNKFTLFSKTGRVEMEGKFNIGSGLKYYTVNAAGTAVAQFRELPDSLLGDTPPPPVEFNLITGLTFQIPEKLVRILQNEIASSSFASSPVQYLSDILYYRKGFSELFPPSASVSEAMSNLNNGLFTFQEKDNPFTFLFSGMNMRWDMDYQSLVTKSPEVGLVSIKGKPISQTLSCYAEFKMPSNEDDRSYIYLQLPNQLYYYFGYRNGILEINSNDNRFMDEASKMKASELILKMPDGQSYEIQIVEANRAQMFLRRAQAAAAAK